MLWSEFKELVRVHLVSYNRTHGAQTLIEVLIRAAAEDLQSAVKQLRVRTEVTPVSSVTDLGYAGRITIAPGSFLDSLYARSLTDPSEMREYTRIPYSSLADMKAGNLRDGLRAYIFDSAKGSVLISQLPSAEDSEVCIEYSAISADFGDADEVNFASGEADAVAEYVLAQLALRLDHDIGGSQLHQQNFRARKRQVMSDRNESHVSTP